MNRVRPALIGLILIALAMPACLGAEAFFGKTTPPSEQVLRFWNASEPSSLDPHKPATQTEFNIITSIFEMLTGQDPETLEPLPGVAERWESRDQARFWIFYLRKNAVWSDGRPVTARDFVWAWQRAADPETASPNVTFLYFIRNGEAISNGRMKPSTLGVRALDDYTLEVEMERPTAFFPKLTSHYIFAPLPQRAIEKWGDKWTEPDKIMSNGSFVLAEHRPYDHLVVVKNQTYWDAATVKLEKVIFLPTDDNSTGINLYKAGEVYTMQSGMIPLPFIKGLKEKKDYVRGTLFATYYYSLNVKKKPLNDVRVRRALNMAIDKRAITDRLIKKGDVPTTTFVPPGVAGYPPPGFELKGPGYDPEQARRLLAEAGYPDGKNFPKITIYFNTHQAHRQIAETIQQMWKEQLNISDVELQNEEGQTFMARLIQRDYDIARDVWQGDYLDPNTFLDQLIADTPGNHSGWVNEEYKRLVETANAEPDPVRRMEMLAKAEKILLDEMPIIPIYHLALSYMAKPFVEGWHTNLLDVHPLKFVSIKSK
jgi:oligopeptide transport system substrate-binding protein